MTKLLEVENLHVHYITENECVQAVNGISFSLEAGKTLGLVGETGAGKSTTALSIMQLVPDPPGLILDGSIRFKGQDLLQQSASQHRKLRGEGISMIFQDPMTALNPIMKVRDQLREVLLTHKKMSKAEADHRVVDILRQVGVQENRIDEYPHQFSGGMKQRVIIAMALLCEPDLLIADEPTTALDVTIQAQVLSLIKELQERYGMSMILITHDLAVVAETSERVAIMYAGQIVEEGSVKDVYNHCRHPYTYGLFGSTPDIHVETKRLTPIPGMTPNAAKLPSGCPLHPRCKFAQPICQTEIPPVKCVNRPGEVPHRFRCHFDPLADEAPRFVREDK